jgi:hypothetical protein
MQASCDMFRPVILGLGLGLALRQLLKALALNKGPGLHLGLDFMPLALTHRALNVPEFHINF